MTGRMLLAGLASVLLCGPGYGQDVPTTASGAEEEQAARLAEETAKTEIANEISVDPRAGDAEIADRIKRVLDVLAGHRGFEPVEVVVRSGIVFLEGTVPSERERNFAGEIARNVEGVVYVDNALDVETTSAWSLAPALTELQELGRDFTRLLPFLLAGLVLLTGSVAVALGVRRLASALFRRRDYSPIVAQLFSNLAALPILVIGLFLALRVSGLTRLALSVLGGTGLFGLVVGIAFRDIFENFLASLLISTNRPFRVGDLIEIDAVSGFVQTVTTRGTVLMTLDGNQIHVPNSVVYKATVTNITANPKRRCELMVGVDYEDDPALAQAAMLTAMGSVELVLDDPPPVAVVDELGPSTVNIRGLFWINGRDNNLQKVKSQVVRAVKRQLEADGLSMPDELREMIFPKGVPVMLTEQSRQERSAPTAIASTDPAGHRGARRERDRSDNCPADDAIDGDMQTEQRSLQQQAAESQLPIESEVLIGGGEQTVTREGEM